MSTGATPARRQPQPQAPSRTIKALLEQSHERLAAVLPKYLTPERVVQVVSTLVYRTPRLQECAPDTVLSAVLQACELGLDLSKEMGEAYLIPRRNKRAGVVECQFQPGYKGLVKLARQSGEIASVRAEVVREGEPFVYRYDPDLTLLHEPCVGSDAPIVLVYAVAKLSSGERQAVALSVAEIEAIRRRSTSADDGPWVTDWAEMAKKGLALDTPIPTPTGWTTMGELEAGDWVFDGNGEPTRIAAVSEVKRIPCYRLTLSCGETIVCDHEHRWPASLGTSGAKYRSRHGWGVHEIGELYAAKRRGTIVSIPVIEFLRLSATGLPIDPWLLGYWLGNGHSRAACVSSHGDDAAEVSERVTRTKYSLGTTLRDPRANCVDVRVRGGMITDLRSLGLLGNKHVPPAYLRASEADRVALLSGLMDSDGCIDTPRGRAIFANTEQKLADAVAELATSIGEVVHRSARICRGFGRSVLAYRVSWQPRREPVTLTRKRERFRPRKLAPYRSIAAIEPCDTVETKCIAVESPVRTYLCGRSMIVTHNTAVRRLCKLLPRSLELATAITADEAEYEDDTGAYVRRPGQTKSQALAQRLRGELPRPEPEFRSDEGVREPLRSESDEPTGEDHGSEREPGEDGPRHS